MKINGAKPDKVITVPAPDGSGDKPLQTAAIDEALLPLELSPTDRVGLMLGYALASLEKTLPSEYVTDDRRLHVLLPAQSTLRGEALDPAQIKALALEAAPAFSVCDWQFDTSGQSGTSALTQLANDPEANSVIFAAVDSLVDVATCFELARARRVMTLGATQGLVPGEAAAAVVLTRAPGEQPVRAWLRGWASEPEPAVGNAETERLMGLRTAIKTALEQAELDAGQLQAVSHALGAEVAGELEWYQIQQQYWHGQRGPEQQRLHQAFGDVGVAALPLQLALTAAEYDHQRGLEQYGFPAPGPVLVCETPNAPVRGAVCLTPA
ncbi:hypothetical protein CAI21_08510 [Alkalilimnicola ehrlichii]|uniref:Uncharacterized protein n=1 Tax=Alkalilimnicola ehrlichii TaxID=351052 RepID=A0A3E0WTZ6_9GAMM|nr:hypothetical protein [Alkalilimnicola ehrlichii]RFA29866.1 hypothetical protein CAI21_08510 [Alkalilimnicola ehrlichii]RFA36454.1 hypothetical protein CAL65_10775 [Alkalilimnicola ehrlichii]